MTPASPKFALLLSLSIVIGSLSCVRTPPHRQLKRIDFHGRLFALETREWKLYEITRNSSGNGVDYHVLAQNVISAALSPDGKYLLYYVDPPSNPTVKDDYLVLLDLGSRSEKRIMAHVDAQLLKWATDSQKFSYQIKGALYVSDLSGNSRLVYQAPSGQYQLRGSDNSYVGGAELHGPIGQTWWIAADQMVIERYLGDLPSFTTKTGDDLGLQPNTTTIAYVAGTPKLVDLKKKWIIRGVCPGQSLVLIGENYRQGQLYLASASELLQANYRPLPGDVNTGGPVYGEDVTRYDYRGGASQNVRFIPGNCKLVYLKDQGENSANTAIVFIDPKTLQESAGPTLDVHQIPEVVFARNTALAVAIHNESPTKGGTLYAMSLVDMNSGQHERLNTMGNLDALNLRLLGWID